MTQRFEMFWDCKQCGTKKLLGITHRNCPNCGNAQDETNRYFPADGEEIAVSNHQYVGADWDCIYCSTPNSQKNNHCIGCGAGKDGTKTVVEYKEVKKPISNYVKSSNANQRTMNNSTDYSDKLVSKADTKNNYIMGGLVFFAVVIIAIFSYLMLVKEDKFVQVVGKDWQREYVLYKYKTVRDSDWCSSMPSDAYNVSSYSAQRGTKDVPDGETCKVENVSLGDGSFRKEKTCTPKYRSVPVYDRKCDYVVDRWRYDHSVKESGDLEKMPRWPNIDNYRLSSVNVLNNVRLNDKNESYQLVLQSDENKEKKWSCNLSEVKWNTFKPGQKLKVQVNLLNIIDCDSLFLN